MIKDLKEENRELKVRLDSLEGNNQTIDKNKEKDVKDKTFRDSIDK